MRTRIALAAALGAVLLGATGCSQGITVSGEFLPETIEGSGVTGSRTYAIGDVHALDVGGMYDVEVAVGPAASLVIDTDDNLFELVTVEEKDGTLHLGLEKAVKTALGLRARLTLPTFDALAASGICDVQVAGADTDHLELDLSGAAEVRVEGRVGSAQIESSGTSEATLDVAGGLVELSCSGASNVRVGGSVKDARVALSGTAEADVVAMEGGLLDADLGGAADLTVGGDLGEVRLEGSGTSVARLGKLGGGRLSCDLSGAAAMTLSGAADRAEVELSGTAKAHLEGLTVKALIVDLSGAAKVVVGDTGSVSGEASGSSRVEYGGSPDPITTVTRGSARIEAR